MTISYAWRAPFTSAELSALHAEGFGHPDDREEHRWERVNRHSLGWVCARAAGGGLAGFVNVAWDGGEHAFVLDTLVAAAHRRAGVGTRLVELAASGARAAGCAWLHVDFEPHLTGFYLDACGFTPTGAGVQRLRGLS
ncbi:GNAT family N-acetyltransferase [Dactylosporangium sp. CA-092794]|uniref:GNAT family N-acetyltransferase n=1 Tax=Dactylosporangium sp. CA-092794 TaxID=3239929 RepID=UPI003D8D1687